MKGQKRAGLSRRALIQEILLVLPLAACERAATSAPGRGPESPAPRKVQGKPQSAGAGMDPAQAAPPSTTLASSPEGAPAEEVIPQTLPRVYLKPLGQELPEDDVIYIEQALRAFYAVEVTRLPASPLPQQAYYRPRSRYRAEKLLTFLRQEAQEDSHVIVGLTASDISTTKGQYEDWGILGLASVGGGECVVSRFRAQRGAQSDLHTRIRLAKTVVHEVGHTFGLRHCELYGCLMEDGKGTVTTTDHEEDLCASCRRLLGDRVLPPGEGSIPWKA